MREISDIEIIALVDDLTRSRFLRYAGASRIISPKTLLGTFIAQITSPPMRNVFPGSIQLFGDLLLVELPIYPGAELIGEKLEEIGIKRLGRRHRGHLAERSLSSQPRARGDRALQLGADGSGKYRAALRHQGSHFRHSQGGPSNNPGIRRCGKTGGCRAIGLRNKSNDPGQARFN